MVVPKPKSPKMDQGIPNSRLRAMFDTVTNGVIVIDCNGLVESYNPAAAELFGYSEDEVVGKNISILMGEPHRHKHDNYIKRYFQTGQKKVIGQGRELHGLRKNGSVFPFELTVTEMVVDEVTLFLGEVRDLSIQENYRKLLHAITTAQQEISRNLQPKLIFEKLLGELLALTQSEYGFIGEISYENNEPVLTTHAITNIAWNDETRQFYAENAPVGLKFTNTKTLFGRVMTTGKPVLSNDPINHPHSGGLPDGHPDLNSFLGLPFFSQQEFVGMMGIANRPGGYEEDLVDFLQPFLVTCSNLIMTLRHVLKREEAENTLRESEARGRAILTGATESIVTINEAGVIEDANPATEIVFGYQVEEVLGKNIKTLMPEPFRSGHDGYLSAYINTGIKKIIGKGREVIGKRKDGEEFPMFLSVNHITVGGRNMFTGVIRDITKEKKDAEELQHLNEDLSLRIGALDALVKKNVLLNQMNRYFQTAETQNELYDILAKFCSELFPFEQGAYFSLDRGEILEMQSSWNGEFNGEPCFKNLDCWAMRQGETKVVQDTNDRLICNHTKKVKHLQSICQPVSTQEGVIGLLHIYIPVEADIDEEQLSKRLAFNKEAVNEISDRLGVAMFNLHLREKLKSESVRDPLTKLFNRRFFSESLELEVRRSKRTSLPVSIALMDVDHFKSFNDNYGHEAGDMVLESIANVLQQNCRKEDLPCRYGGEEFAIVFVGVPKEQALPRVELIREIIQSLELFYDGKSLPKITISAGIASIPDDSDDQAGCLRAADKALYAAKSNGRNRVMSYERKLCMRV